MNTKITLNIGLKTYLGQELTLQQVQDTLQGLCSHEFGDSVKLRTKEVVGSYEGREERTVVVLIEYSVLGIWVSNFIERLCALLCQECIPYRLVPPKDSTPLESLVYHADYSIICASQNKFVNRQVFDDKYFINF